MLYEVITRNDVHVSTLGIDDIIAEIHRLLWSTIRFTPNIHRSIGTDRRHPIILRKPAPQVRVFAFAVNILDEGVHVSAEDFHIAGVFICTNVNIRSYNFV